MLSEQHHSNSTKSKFDHFPVGQGGQIFFPEGVQADKTGTWYNFDADSEMVASCDGRVKRQERPRACKTTETRVDGDKADITGTGREKRFTRNNGRPFSAPDIAGASEGDKGGNVTTAASKARTGRSNNVPAGEGAMSTVAPRAKSDRATSVLEWRGRGATNGAARPGCDTISSKSRHDSSGKIGEESGVIGGSATRSKRIVGSARENAGGNGRAGRSGSVQYYQKDALAANVEIRRQESNVCKASQVLVLGDGPGDRQGLMEEDATKERERERERQQRQEVVKRWLRGGNACPSSIGENEAWPGEVFLC